MRLKTLGRAIERGTLTVKVHDLRATASTAYSWDFVTSRYTNFHHHLHAFDDQAFAASMHRWNDRVKREVPADRLLVWDPRDGWEPLCRFLGKPVPDTPYPRTNSKDDFVNRFRRAS